MKARKNVIRTKHIDYQNLTKNEMEEKRMKFKFVGLGAAGNKAVMELVGRGFNQEDIILVNSTDKDFPTEYKGNRKIVLKPDNTGCGKERNIAKEYAIRAINAGVFDNLFEENDTNIMLVTSVEGGTGSGSTPIIAEYISDVLGLNVHICAFIGFEDDVRGLQNTVEFFQEVSGFDADIMSIRNSAFHTSNKFRAEELANKEFVDRVRVLTGKDMITSSQNIDDTDIFKVVSTFGYKTVETIYFDNNLLDVEQFNKLCKQMIYESKSVKSENPGMIRLGVILNIAPGSEDAIDYQFTTLKDEYGNPYEFFFHKQYDGKKQFIQYIASGMKLPIDEVIKIHERYKESSNRVDKKKDDFFEKINSLSISSEDSAFDMGRGVKKAKRDKSAFMKGLETTPEEE